MNSRLKPKTRFAISRTATTPERPHLLPVDNKVDKFDEIHILYDYGNIMSFSGTYEDEEDNVFKIDIQGEQLAELQNILSNYNIESDEYKIEETGHYHGSTFYGGIIIIPAEYKVKFNDGSEMIIDERDYEIQYKNGNNYYLITDGKEISQKIIKFKNFFQILLISFLPLTKSDNRNNKNNGG